MADTALRRQPLKVGARCVSYARRDLCRGRAAMRVSTAIPERLGAETDGASNVVGLVLLRL